MLASFGLLNRPQKNGTDVEAVPKVKGGAKRHPTLGKKAWLAQNTVTAGAQDVASMYHAGNRLLKPERNLSMAHAPRVGKDVFCWDWNSHGGCSRGDKCVRKHDIMSDKNLHCAVLAELVRRGGHVKREYRIAPGNIDGAIDQLRESNKRTHGERPIAPSKAWWKKTAGAYSGNFEGQSCNISDTGWKVGKRDFDWNSLHQKMEGRDAAPSDGKGNVEVASR